MGFDPKAEVKTEIPSLDPAVFKGPPALGPGGSDNIQFRTWGAFKNTPSFKHTYLD
jgi:hypothetical protein